MESFFHSLEAELARGESSATERALRTALAGYVRYYNATRLHSALGYVSPIAFDCVRALGDVNHGVHESGARSRAVIGTCACGTAFY